ncbi:MAG: hypothetical protein H0X37_19045 [Herpetosiphonaceae bacterium]|nr:hypothetical protein [Herpetosiphonaceae bacterium]
MATKDTDPDPKGERGGDTGHTKQKGKGEQAEKGDQRREEMGNEGPTRPGAQGDHHSQSGSHSNESK